MYQQRAEPEERPEALLEAGDAEAPWLPPSLGAARLAAPPERAHYVVIDDLDGPTAVLVWAPWPRVDAHGRLGFGRAADRHSLTRRRREVQAEIDRARTALGAPAPTRPLRIGDTFLVVPASDDPASAWHLIVDVTSDARDAAKVALYAAVTPRVDEGYATEVGLVDPHRESEEPPDLGPGPTASPRV